MKISNKLLTLGLALAFTVSSCDNEKLLELNVNPNAANEIDMNYLLAYSQLQLSGGRYENWRAMLIYSSTMMQHFATLPTYWSGDKYLYNAGYSSSLWDRYYPSVMKEITWVVDNTKDDPALVNTYNIARIIRVVAMSRITDMYGDAPYFQAGRGFDGEENWRPAYDSQEDIYNDMISELQAAVAGLDAGEANPGVQDLMYGGDLVKWEKFANSLLLRMGLRVMGVDNALGTTAVNAAIAGGVMTDNADIAKIDHTDGPSGINNNGIGEVFNFNGTNFSTDDSPRFSETFVNMLQAKGDPRLAHLSWVVGGGADLGMPNGLDATTVLTDPTYTGDMDDYSRINPLFVLRNSPMVFQSYAEVEYMLAEANELGFATGSTADAHYAAGVNAAMHMYTIYDGSLAIDQADVDAYIAANPYSSANHQQILGEEYWLATLLNEYETYSNWRRTGFPALTPTNYPGNETGGQIPRRLIYPNGEASSNPDSWAAAHAAQGIDDGVTQSRFMTKMWWDVN